MINYDEIMATIIGVNTKNAESANSKNFLKTDMIGNSITGRFLPNIKDVENSIYEYAHHGFKSKIDGSGIFQLCPSTWREKCPTCKNSIAMWKSENPVDKDTSKFIRRRQNWLVNFYVINDVKHPENNNTVKILKYGKQIKAKYDMATTGDDKDIYGTKIWRLDEQGCSFRIKCEQNSESKEAWPTYTNSGFLPPSKIEGMTEAKINEILNSVFNLNKLYTSKSYNDMLTELNTHFFGNNIVSINAPTESLSMPVTESKTPVQQQEKVQNTEEATTSTSKNAAGGSNLSDTELDNMLKELQG